MIFRLLIAFSLLFAVACESTTAPTPSRGGEVSIAYLKSLCTGDHYRVVSDYSVRGVVVATDWLGELHKSAIIIDKTSGLEFAIESHNINKQLPVFSEVTIFCNGLMLARIGGKIELGLPPTGDFPLDNIDDEKFGRYIRIEGINSDIVAPTKRFSEIGASDICGLVKFERVRVVLDEPKMRWCNFADGAPQTTFRTLVDSEGNSFDVRILPTCHYAGEEVPTNEISVIGVIDYSDNRYFLRIINKSIIE